MLNLEIHQNQHKSQDPKSVYISTYKLLAHETRAWSDLNIIYRDT